MEGGYFAERERERERVLGNKCVCENERECKRVNVCFRERWREE